MLSVHVVLGRPRAVSAMNNAEHCALDEAVVFHPADVSKQAQLSFLYHLPQSKTRVDSSKHFFIGYAMEPTDSYVFGNTASRMHPGAGDPFS